MSEEVQHGTRLGVIGETVVKLHLLRKGFEVYIGDDNTSVDMLALHLKTGRVIRIEVKTTRRRNPSDTGWKVDIRKSYGDYPFNHDDVDYLAVYIEPEDRVLFLTTSSFSVAQTLTLHDNDLKNSFDLLKDFVV